MKLTLLPLENDNLIRVRCEGHVSSPHLSSDGDPLVVLLGPMCHTHRVLLNLEKVRSIDTGGVCWLLSLDKQFRAKGGRFVLFQVPGVVLDVLNVLRLAQLLPIASDEAAARELATKTEEAGNRVAGREGTPTDGTIRPRS